MVLYNSAPGTSNSALLLRPIGFEYCFDIFLQDHPLLPQPDYPGETNEVSIWPLGVVQYF
jgi:hypothetical protein